jgi:hypothetical protein
MIDARGDQQLSELFTRHLTRAGNLVNEPVTSGDGTLDVILDLPEIDTEYGVSVTTNWLTTVAITAKATTGYTITFGTVAPADAVLDATTFRTGG